MNKLAWIGMGVMVAAVLLYLGDLITDFARPALPWIAAVGGVLFVGGLALAWAHNKERAAPGLTEEPEGHTDSRKAA